MHRSRALATSAALALSTVALLASGFATGRVSAADGAQLAASRCGHCHATGPAPETSPQAIAPPFRELHLRYPIDMLAEALDTNVISGHDEMPMFDFSREEIRALLSHIDQLAPDQPGYVERNGRASAR